MRERLDLVSNLRGEVEERMLRDLTTPPMNGEIVSHTLTLSNRVMVSHYPRDGWVGKVFRDLSERCCSMSWLMLDRCISVLSCSRTELKFEIESDN